MSVVSICNGALTLVGASLITSLTDDTERAEQCSEHYGPVLRATLARAAWTFAMKRASIAQSATSPVFTWANAYQLPPDYIRLLSTNIDGAPYAIEGDKLVTDEAGPVKIQYIWEVTDTGLFPENFREYLEYRLANKLVFRLKQQISSKLIEKLKDDLLTAELVALSTDAQENADNTYDETSLEAARRQGSITAVT